MVTDVRSPRRPADRRPNKTATPPAARTRPPDRSAAHKRPPRRWWRFRRPLFVVAFAGFALVAGGIYYVAQAPLPKAPTLAQTSFVYDSAGNVLASFDAGQNRVDVSLRQVPQVLIDAVVSTEDRHFFTEGALNPVSTLRALWSDLSGGNLQGGSTITQQYVKVTYTAAQRTIARKIKEAVIAEKVDRKYTKTQILQDYLNTIYFGRGAYGVEAASKAYFGENVGRLGLAQASLLAGLIHDPEGDDPAHDPTAARQRQAVVLAGMLRDHKVSAAQVRVVETTPMSSYVEGPTVGTGITMNVANGDQYFIDDVRQQLIARFGPAVVYGGGLRVTTTLDPTLQADAYNAVYRAAGSLDPAKGDPAGALVSVDDQGNVRAMVGGQNYATSQVNLALGKAGGGSGRQAGSTFKAFLLAQLVKEGYSVDSQLPAPPEVVVAHGNSNGSSWVVKNFESESPGKAVSIVDATAQSINTVFAQLVEKIGPAALEQIAIQMGISPSEIGDYPSLVLGAAAVSPLEMASAYSTFADGGVHSPASVITKVTTANGTPLPWPHPAAKAVLDAHSAAVVDYTLEQVVQRGTGTAASVGVPLAGKTGTTDNSTDAWFIGYTPTLTTAVWMGYPQGSRPLSNFRGYTSIQGGTIPAQLFEHFMAAVLRGSGGPGSPWGGASFPPPGSLGGQYLYVTPANEQEISFPEGLGTTTTTAPPTSTVPPSSSTTAATKAGSTPGGTPASGTATTVVAHPSTTSTPPTTSPSATTTTRPAAPPTTR